jgi:hypothetical protein
MRGSAIALAAVVVLAAAPAFGQGKPEDAQNEARATGERALALFEAQKWDEAFATFSEADRLYHAPTLVLYMANCRRNQGRLVEARALYLQVVSEPLPRLAPERFKKAQATAGAEAQELDKRIGTARIAVSGPGADRARVTVDGSPISAEELAAGKPLDPGAHTFAAESGRAHGSITLTLAPGASTRVAIGLLLPEAPRPIWPAGAAFGVGGVGLLLAAVTGGLALREIRDVHAACPRAADGAWHCPPAQPSVDRALASKVRSAKALSAASYATLTVGILGVGTGAAWLVLRPSFGGTMEKVRWIGLEGRF